MLFHLFQTHYFIFVCSVEFYLSEEAHECENVYKYIVILSWSDLNFWFHLIYLKRARCCWDNDHTRHEDWPDVCKNPVIHEPFLQVLDDGGVVHFGEKTHVILPRPLVLIRAIVLISHISPQHTCKKMGRWTCFCFLTCKLGCHFALNRQFGCHITKQQHGN